MLGLEEYHGTESFFSHALTLEAERELEEAARDGRPFYLNFAHYAVHTPIHKDERFYQAYRDAGLDDAEARYAALIEGYDHSLGRIWPKLEELDLADDTLILFFSDNGGLTAHARGGAPDGGEQHRLAIPAGGRCTSPVQATDLYMSILQLAGVPEERIAAAEADGQSLLPLLRGAAEPERALKMQERLRAWLRETGAQMPRDAESGEPLPLP